MTSVLFKTGGVSMNDLAVNSINFIFLKLMDHGRKEHKKDYLALEKLQRARDKWNENRMKPPDFIYKRLCEKK